MKKLTILSIVVIMLALSVIPAFAAGGPPANRGTASGDCTGDQVRLGTGNQVGRGTGKQISNGARTPYALSGTITTIDPAAKTVTVTVVCGNRLVKPYIGTDVTLQTKDTTRFLLRDENGTVTPITFAELTVGLNVSSQANLVNEIWTATRVTAGALLNCLP